MIKHLIPQREFMDHIWKMDDNALENSGVSEEVFGKMKWELTRKLHAVQEKNAKNPKWI